MNTLKNRPIAPHLTIYSSEFTSIYSIWHRMTGIGLILLLIISIFFFKISTLDFFFFFGLNFKFNLWLKNAIYLNFLVLISYHALNGIRHIFWDLGYNLIIGRILKSVVLSTFILFILFFIIFIKIII